MAHTLLLRLPAPGQEDTEWLTIDEAGEPATARQRGPLSLAAAVGRSAKVVGIAPATQILLAEPELPPGSGVKLARAVPFALEEQLTEDIDQLSFAIGRPRPRGGTDSAAGASPCAQKEQRRKDSDHLTLAPARRPPRGGTPVAAVSRAVLQ